MIKTTMNTQYAVALPLTELIRQQLEQLHSSDGFSVQAESPQSLAERTGKLMCEMTCHIIDYIFTDMVQQFASVKELTADKIARFKESLQQIEEIKGIIYKYFGRAVAWLDHQRLKPVIGYYYQIINQCSIAGESVPCLIYDIPDSLAAKAMTALDELKSLKASDALQAIEYLIEIVEIGVCKLLKEPKQLLKFNFIANKTLDGVMSMTTALSYKSLRKLGQAMDPMLFDSAASHLHQFIIPHPLNWHEAAGTNLALHPSIS